MKKSTIILLTCVSVLVIAALFWFREKPGQRQTGTNTPPVETVQPPADWKTFTDPTFGYVLRIPPDVLLRENTSDTNRFAPSGPISDTPLGLTHFLAVSVFFEGLPGSYNQSYLNSLLELKIGESKPAADGAPGQGEWFTYTRTADMNVNGQTIYTYQNSNPWEKPEGTTEYVYLLPMSGQYYFFAGYIPAEQSETWNKQVLDSIVSSLELPKEMATCTMDAKVCPDGSSVGRVGMKCAFQACPIVPEDTQNWQIIDTSDHFRVRVPANWKVTNSEDNNGAMQITRIEGPEGWVQFATGTGFGGACDNTWTQIQTVNRLLTACEGRQENGTIILSQMSTEIRSENGQSRYFDGVAQIEAPSEQNLNTVYTILSSLEFK